jgi:hypothetical protein
MDLRPEIMRLATESDRDYWKSRALAMAEVIREVEWVWKNEIRKCVCPICDSYQDDGHDSGCKLAAVLSGKE